MSHPAPHHAPKTAGPLHASTRQHLHHTKMKQHPSYTQGFVDLKAIT